MNPHVHGIHHVTAMAGNPQKNIDFYVGALGLRMVKKTVNFDDPFTYHFYYGDEAGAPGSIITFFPWGNTGLRGRRGNGQLTVTAFSIPGSSLDYWMERLAKLKIHFAGPYTRFGEEEVLTLFDPDGLELELVASAREKRPGWENGETPGEHAIRGFHSVALSVESYQRTAGLMSELLGFRRLKEEGNRLRFEAGERGPGAIVDILNQPDGFRGTMGVGVVHHVAWRIKNDEAQLQLREKLAQARYSVSPVRDRNYFHSIYFREPGGILFEVATDPPGFAIDEEPGELGSALKLPSWLEPQRREIEEHLPPVSLPK